MACGCVPVLPLQGGASEYAEHGVNSLLVDTADTNAITEAAASLISGQYSLSALREAAIMTAQGYSVPIATGRTYQMFKYVADHWPRGGPP
jgi:glycosyltransferase involved in cell wall biosynthesis